jgi:small subunit ribosomal protein S16
MLRIRLRRIGKKHQPFYRVVVAEHKRASSGGKIVEELGTFDPAAEKGKGAVSLLEERIAYWLGVGAQPSATMAGILRRELKLAI